MKRWAVALWALGCSTCPAPAAQPAVSASVNARLNVRLDCEGICRAIERSCRQACVPQAWSPEMRSRQSACEHDCDFSRFSCVHECRGR